MFPGDLSRETRNLAFLDPSEWLVLQSPCTLMLKASLFIKNRDIFSEIKNHSPAGHAAERTKINESKMAKEKLFVMIHGAISSVRNNDQIIFKSYSFYDIISCSASSSEPFQFFFLFDRRFFAYHVTSFSRMCWFYSPIEGIVLIDPLMTSATILMGHNH